MELDYIDFFLSGNSERAEQPPEQLSRVLLVVVEAHSSHCCCKKYLKRNARLLSGFYLL